MIHANVVDIKILKVASSQGIGWPVITPAPGAVMLVVSYTISNATSDVIGVADVPELARYDKDRKLLENGEKTIQLRRQAEVSGRAGFGPHPRFLNPGVGYNDVAVFDVAKDGFDPVDYSAGFEIGGLRVKIGSVVNWPEPNS